MVENTQEKTTEYALVTGATGGLGKAFVYALAKRGYALLLTGRSAEKLQALKSELLTQYENAEIWTYPAELDKEDSRVGTMQAIQKDGHKISLLANVAGADIQKGLTE